MENLGKYKELKDLYQSPSIVEDVTNKRRRASGRDTHGVIIDRVAVENNTGKCSTRKKTIGTHKIKIRKQGRRRRGKN